MAAASSRRRSWKARIVSIERLLMSSPKDTSPEMIEMSAVEGVLMTPQVKTRSLPSWSQASQCLFIT